MILIAFGANLSGSYGAPEGAWSVLPEALEMRGLKVLCISSLWLSAPVPVSDQPWYHNAVMQVEGELDAQALLLVLHEVEALFGRDRSSETRNAARVIDLDILAYHDEVLKSEGLVLPHPRLHERGFVLYPLQEIAPDWIHPVSGLSVEAMIEALPSDAPEVKRL